MTLSKIPNATALRQSYQAEFGGLHHRKGASDGELYDMRNMTSDHYPVLSPREKRRLVASYDQVFGVYCYGADTFIAATKNGDTGLYKDGEKLLSLTPDDKQMDVCSKKLCIFPDKVYYDLNTGESGSMSASIGPVAATFRSGELNGSAVKNNEIYVQGADFSVFKAGDSVTISGCSVVEANNKTLIVREVHGNRLEFSEYAFDMEIAEYEFTLTEDLPYQYPAGVSSFNTITYGFYAGTKPVFFRPDKILEKKGLLTWTAGDTVVKYCPYSEGSYGQVYRYDLIDFELDGGFYTNTELPFTPIYTKEHDETITIERVIPDFDFILQANNRLWGAKGDTVWGSKLGDPTNWNNFEGIATDSYSVELGSAGDITGIANYNGYPTFFKEDGIYKLYGAYPSAFQLYATNTKGVKTECGKSIAKIGDALFYVSKNGVMMYAGGVPTYIGNELGVRIATAVGGTDGRKYYLSADTDEGRKLYVYDTFLNLWHIEDELEVVAMSYGNELVAGAEDGQVMTLGFSENATEADLDWEVRFADAVVGSPNKKGVQEAIVRADCSGGGWCEVFVLFDGTEEVRMGRIEQDGKYSTMLPIILRRGDHFAIILRGHGIVDIYGLSYKYYHGSEMR